MVGNRDTEREEVVTFQIVDKMVKCGEYFEGMTDSGYVENIFYLNNFVPAADREKYNFILLLVATGGVSEERMENSEGGVASCEQYEQIFVAVPKGK